MLDPFARSEPEFEVRAGQRVKGTVIGLGKAEGRDFVTTPVSQLALTFDGIPGDFHAGPTRKSGGREPWYPRGTEMRNERQISILAPDELRTIARRLSIPELKMDWIGGNLLLDGIPNLTMLPPRTLLFFENGVTLKVDGDNAPCRYSGRSIASNFEGRDDIEIAFAQQSRNLRGLVGWVEKPGVISLNENFQARIPPQWIYEADND